MVYLVKSQKLSDLFSLKHVLEQKGKGKRFLRTPIVLFICFQASIHKVHKQKVYNTV